MKKTVLFALLNDYGDWESAFLSAALQWGVESGQGTDYRVKTVSVKKEPVCTIGGFYTFPDYDVQTAPSEFAALVLVGGMQWGAAEAEQFLPLVRQTVEQKRVLGAICNASLFLGAHGYLNSVKHTSNGLDALRQWAGEAYTGGQNYIHRQAVSDNNIVTANGTGYLEFAKEILLLLNVDTPDAIDRFYAYNKQGMCELSRHE